MVYSALSQIAVIALALSVNAAPFAPQHEEHVSAPTEPYIQLNDSAALNLGPKEIPPSNYSTGLPLPNATYTEPANGLATALVAPYTPHGGLETSPDSVPYFHPLSDFDFESFKLVLYQEYIELDLFQYGLARFTKEEFATAGMNEADVYLLGFMAEQERGHARLVSNILGEHVPMACKYDYTGAFTNVTSYVDFNQRLTRWGESGVYGFLEHLDSRAAAGLLLQSITTEARQQMIFRQFSGLFPMPVWFEIGLPQSWAWTLLAPWIASCSAETPPLAWENFPALTVTNNPPAINPQFKAALSNNHVAPSYSGKKVEFIWEAPGNKVGPNKSYTTSTSAGKPTFAVWVSQLNITYTPLTVTSNSSGYAYQPNVKVFEGDPSINGTMFVALTDADTFLTSFNLSLINPHVVAGPSIYMAG